MSKFQATRDYLEAVKEDIANYLDSSGMTTTGQAKSSLVVVQGRSPKTGRFEASFKLLSVDYLPILYTGVGAKPAKFPPFQPGSKLYNWVVNKGITFTRAGRLLTRRQTSFLIARKIHQEGTRIFRGKPGIPIDRIIQDNSQQYLNKLADTFEAEIIQEWDKAIIA